MEEAGESPTGEPVGGFYWGAWGGPTGEFGRGVLQGSLAEGIPSR